MKISDWVQPQSTPALCNFLIGKKLSQTQINLFFNSRFQVSSHSIDDKTVSIKLQNSQFSSATDVWGELYLFGDEYKKVIVGQMLFNFSDTGVTGDAIVSK